MTKKYFGTDGIRGAINSKHINGDMFFKFGLASGTYFRSQKKRKQIAIIAKDTRLSGYTLEPALVSGLASAGMHVYTFGPMPTNGLAMLTKTMKANMGIMITASHNPHNDNGLKLFGPDGMKLSDKIEKKIEKLIDKKISKNLSSPEKLGRVKRLETGTQKYIKILKKNFIKEFNLRGLRIVIDCANGAAYKVAPTVLRELGAEVISLGVEPDGYNINANCGSTSTELMQAQVIVHGADIGVALDGDADRALIANENGEMINGDQIMGLIADYWSREGRLNGGIVATVMSNLGLERFIESLNLRLVRTNVGDRYVMEEMRSNKFNLGGEQSGHIVLSDYSTTGDGLIAVLQVMAVIQKIQLPVSEVCNVFDPVPQLIKNIEIKNSVTWETDSVKKVIIAGEKKLRDNGRILVRNSGTEPLIRIMAEGDDHAVLNQVVDDIVSEIEQSLNL